MPSEDVLANRLVLLRGIVRSGAGDAPEQVQGFLVRALARMPIPAGEPLIVQEPSVDDCLRTTRFGGYPSLARSGYCLGHRSSEAAIPNATEAFLRAVAQQRDRPAHSQVELAGDAIALLGIADGLRAIGQAQTNSESLDGARTWLGALLDQHGGSDPRLSRARLLARDLLDAQGRLGRRLANSGDPRVAALDLCLWQTWPDVLRTIEFPDTHNRRALFKRLLTDPLPAEGEVLHAATWLAAIGVLTDDLAAAVVPDAHQVARILAATQGSFRRWRWESQPTRKQTMRARWLIDKEADIQAFLLAVLYPYFRGQLQDEQYLAGYGLRQGRFDFAITSLRLIVEVKVVRVTNDIDDLEAQIMDDLSLYFQESNPFDSMIIYIYDDRDTPEPEKYPALRDAFRRRSNRIVDVILVRRPSMIPNRGARSA
jgi:hypothetical protein